MENKESVSTELDPNVPVEDVVTALNDAVAEESSNNVQTYVVIFFYYILIVILTN